MVQSQTLAHGNLLGISLLGDFGDENLIWATVVEGPGQEERDALRKAGGRRAHASEPEDKAAQSSSLRATFVLSFAKQVNALSNHEALRCLRTHRNSICIVECTVFLTVYTPVFDVLRQMHSLCTDANFPEHHAIPFQATLLAGQP
jgi:hypothetical protein